MGQKVEQHLQSSQSDGGKDAKDFFNEEKMALFLYILMKMKFFNIA